MLPHFLKNVNMRRVCHKTFESCGKHISSAERKGYLAGHHKLKKLIPSQGGQQSPRSQNQIYHIRLPKDKSAKFSPTFPHHVAVFVVSNLERCGFFKPSRNTVPRKPSFSLHRTVGKILHTGGFIVTTPLFIISIPGV